MAGEGDVYLGKPAFLLRILTVEIAGRNAKHMVVQFFQQLSVLPECLLGIPDAQIEERLTVSHKIDRLAVDGTVRVVSDSVAFKDFLGLLQSVTTLATCSEFDKSCLDCLHVVELFLA